MLAKELYLRRKTYAFFSYPGTDHFLEGETLELAAKRDAEFFSSRFGTSRSEARSD